jgi:hypothetical protein
LRELPRLDGAAMIARLLAANGEEIAQMVTSVFDDDHPIVFGIGPEGAGRRPVALEVTVTFREWMPDEEPPLPGDTVTVTADAASCAITSGRVNLK